MQVKREDSTEKTGNDIKIIQENNLRLRRIHSLIPQQVPDLSIQIYCIVFFHVLMVRIQINYSYIFQLSTSCLQRISKIVVSTSILEADENGAKALKTDAQPTEEEKKIEIGMKAMLYCIWILGML